MSEINGLNSHALDLYKSISSRYLDCKAILDEIESVNATLSTMSRLTDLRIVTSNDSYWNPHIDTQVIRTFVKDHLEDKLLMLRRKFNKIMDM